MNRQILTDKDLQKEMLGKSEAKLLLSMIQEKAAEVLNRDARQRVGRTQERQEGIINVVAQPLVSLGSSE